MDQWCAARQQPRREVLPIDDLWALSRAWYDDRMSPAYRGRTAREARAIFRAHGLTSRFWGASGEADTSQA